MKRYMFVKMTLCFHLGIHNIICLELVKSKKHAKKFIMRLRKIENENILLQDKLVESNLLVDRDKEENMAPCDKIARLERKLNST